jgi:hypothetical protein
MPAVATSSGPGSRPPSRTRVRAGAPAADSRPRALSRWGATSAWRPGAAARGEPGRRAVGQIRPAHAYGLLEAHEVTVAQVLLTLEDSGQRRRYPNARATLEALLALGALPVINENDTAATAEIRYGDNDRLAAGSRR